MDSPQLQNDQKEDNPQVVQAEIAQLEALVTPEQVLSATVARKRRNLTKKTVNRVREPTPGRDLPDKDEAREEATEKPKTPERRRRKSTTREAPDDASSVVSEEPKAEDVGAVKEKKKDLVEITQAEVMSLYNKAKRTLATNRDRIKRRVEKASQRSSSMPGFTENELLEGLRRGGLLLDDSIRRRSRTASIPSSSEEDVMAVPPPPRKPHKSHTLLKKKKPPQARSAKVIEILDPKTSSIVARISKGSNLPPFYFYHIFLILKYYTIGEMIYEFRVFKRDMKSEWKALKGLVQRCVADLLIFFIIFGLGGIMFKYVEGAFENFYKCGVKRVKRDFIDVLWYRSHNLREEEWKSLARSKLRSFEEELHLAHEAGMHTYSGQRSWSFINGLLYCLTVVSTVGNATSKF